MKPAQNFKNHPKLVKGFHGVLFLSILALLGGSVSYFFLAEEGHAYPASLFLLTTFIFLVLVWYTRQFPLKAQDRAIRAEENLRHYVLTGKLLPDGLRMGQIIALRFAPDEEFLLLLDRAIKEGLNQKEIKMAIKNWKPDYYRV
jgi:hypothetical protein